MSNEIVEVLKVVVNGIQHNNVDQVRWAIQQEPSLLKRLKRFEVGGGGNDNPGDNQESHINYFFEDIGGFTIPHLGFSDDIGYDELDDLSESEEQEFASLLGYVHGEEKANQILLLSPAITPVVHDELWKKSDTRNPPLSSINQIQHHDLYTEYDPLSLCIICGRVEIARVLICELGADCSKQLNSHEVPLYPACLTVKYRQPDILRLMIGQLSTEDLNAIATTALLWCNIEILDVLYESGVLLISSDVLSDAVSDKFPETYRIFSPSQVSTLLEWLIERDLVNDILLAWLQRSCLAPELNQELNQLVDQFGFVCCAEDDYEHFRLDCLTATSMPSFDAYRWWNDFDGWDDYKIATCVKDLLRPDIVFYGDGKGRENDYPVPLHHAKHLALAARLVDRSPQILLMDLSRCVEHDGKVSNSYCPLVDHIRDICAYELLDHSMHHLERLVADGKSAAIAASASFVTPPIKRRRKGYKRPKRIISYAEKLGALAAKVMETISAYSLLQFQLVARHGDLGMMMTLLPQMYEFCSPYHRHSFWKSIGEGLAAALQYGHREQVRAFMNDLSTGEIYWNDTNGTILAADSCRTALMRRHDWELVDFVNKLLFFTGDAKDALAETVRDELLHQVFRYQWYEGQCQAYYLSPAVECIYRMHFGECLKVMSSVLLRASHSEASLDYRLEMCRRFMLLLDYTVEKFGRRTLDHVEIPQLVVFMVRYGPMEWLRRLHAHDMLYPTDECRDDRYMGAVCRRGSVEVLEMIADEAYRRGGVGELRKILSARDAATRMLTTVQVAERYGEQGVVEWLGRLQERVDVEMSLD